MTSFDGIFVNTGSKTLVTVEIDWNRPNMRKDFAISVWATSTAVTIREVSTSKVSAKHWLYGDAVITPPPAPVETCSASANKFSWGSSKSAIQLFNGCTTRLATISITMPTTSWSYQEQANAGFATPACTISGSNRTCSYPVATGGVSKQGVLLFGTAWDGIFTSSIVLA